MPTLTVKVSADLAARLNRASKQRGLTKSELARRAMTQHVPARGAKSVGEPEAFYGFKPFPSRGAVVSNEQIDRLRDDEGI